MMICQISKKKNNEKQSGQEVCALHAPLCYRVLRVHRPHRLVPTIPPTQAVYTRRKLAGLMQRRL